MRHSILSKYTTQALALMKASSCGWITAAAIGVMGASCEVVEDEGIEHVTTPANAVETLQIDGDINEVVYQNGKFFVRGWACQKGIDKSIRIHVYVGGSAYDTPKGTHVFSGTANLPAEQAVGNRCATSGVNHRFLAEIPYSVIREYNGERIWVHGLRTVGGTEIRNRELDRSGVHTIPSPEVIGNVDDVYRSGGRYYIRGWTCQQGVAESIGVHVYVGASAYDSPKGRYVLSGNADLASEQAVSDRCGTSGVNHRYVIEVPPTVQHDALGEPIFVHGLRSFDYGSIRNAALTRSGEFTMPVPEVIGKVENIALEDDGYYVNGWTCQVGVANSLGIHLYAGASAYDTPKGEYIMGGNADLMAEGDVRRACGDVGSRYRFHLRIPNDKLTRAAGHPLYVHGLRSIPGTTNSALDISGDFRFPLPLSAHPRGCMAPHYVNQRRSVYLTPYVQAQGTEWTYVAWVWRDTGNAATNHHISVMRSRDLIHWENTCGESLSVPVGGNSAAVVDPVSMGAGVLNGRLKLSTDIHGNPIIVYQKHRYVYSRNAEPKVTTQIYIARLLDGHWQVDEATDWQVRHEFGGGGTLPSSSTSPSFSDVKLDMNGQLYIGVAPARDDATGLPRKGTYYLEDDGVHLSIGETTYDVSSDDPYLHPRLGAYPSEVVNVYDNHGPPWQALRRPPSDDGRWSSLRGDWDNDGRNQGGLFDRRRSRFYFRDGPNTQMVGFGNRNTLYWPIIGNWGEDGAAAIGLYYPVLDRYYLRHILKGGNADETYTGAIPSSYTISDGPMRWHDASPTRTTLIKYDTLPANRDKPYDCEGTPLDDKQDQEWTTCPERFTTDLKFWRYDMDTATWEGSRIDTAWGARVAFGFTVFKDYQIAVYYNANRKVTVSLRRDREGEWRMPVTLESRRPFDGWDSHNTLILFVDENHDIHIAGNQHNTPLNYWRSNGLNLESVSPRAMVYDGDGIEAAITYPQFFRGPTGDLLFTFRYGSSGNGDWYIYKYDLNTKQWSPLHPDGLPIFSHS